MSKNFRELEILARLKALYPGNARELCELRFNSPFELVVATVLSAQCTDTTVNVVTSELFQRFPTTEQLAEASRDEVERIIYSTGFYRNKAVNIVRLAQELLLRFDGEVPQNMSDLVQLPGVGRKTANVVLSVAYGRPGLAVDTHVRRLSQRLGLTQTKDPVKIEAELNEWVPREESGGLSLRLILHGRRICSARKPKCIDCVLNDVCPSSSASG